MPSHYRSEYPEISVSSKGRRCAALFFIFLSGAGCGPQFHDGREMASHRIERAQVLDDAMSIQGSLPLYAYTDYGVKLVSCQDDTGKELRLQSAQIFWMKGEFFELELDPPAPDATEVSLDLLFTTRSGLQRSVQTLKIDRSAERGFHSQRQRWRRTPVVEATSEKKKSYLSR